MDTVNITEERYTTECSKVQFLHKDVPAIPWWLGAVSINFELRSNGNTAIDNSWKHLGGGVLAFDFVANEHAEGQVRIGVEVNNQIKPTWWQYTKECFTLFLKQRGITWK